MSGEPNSALKEHILRGMRAKETEELLQIWKGHDLSQWSEAALEAAREVLAERLGEVPPPEPGTAPPEKTAGAGGGAHKGFIWGWLLVNLLGWTFGVLYVFMFQSGEVREVLSGITSTNTVADGIFLILGRMGLALGIVLGLMQSILLAVWKMPALWWILVTAAGWGLPAFSIPLLRRYLLFHDGFMVYLQNLWIIYPAVFLIIGALIGTIQALILEKRMARPGLWALANAIGMLVFSLLVKEMLKLPLGILTGPIDFLLVPQKRAGLEAMPLATQWLLIGVLVPILAALLTGLPTGMVYAKYGFPVEETTHLAEGPAGPRI